MKRIKLSQGKVALVCDCHFDSVKNYKWSYDNQYARRVLRVEGKSVNIYMHRLVNATPSGMITDHINNDRLDNRCSNLRTVTSEQNVRNMIVVNPTGYRGVQKTKWGWIAQIASNPRIPLGTYKSPEEAALAWDSAAIQLYGEYAKLNLL